MLGLAWLWWPEVVSTTFNECIQRREEYPTYHQVREEHSLPVIINVWVRLRVACVLHVANGYRDALVAFSGVAVAAFTATLWWSTDKLWQITRLAVNDGKKAAAAAVKAAEASIASLAHAKETAARTFVRG